MRQEEKREEALRKREKRRRRGDLYYMYQPTVHYESAAAGLFAKIQPKSDATHTSSVHIHPYQPNRSWGNHQADTDTGGSLSQSRHSMDPVAHYDAQYRKP